MHPLSNVPACEEIAGYGDLRELALNFSWSWMQNHRGDQVWKQLDLELWKLTRNPWVVLQTVSRERLAAAFRDPSFAQLVKELGDANRQEVSAPAWYQQHHDKEALKCVAYFSMEFMLGEALPIYSGGLGNVAGDQLKAASDLGLPVIGVGLLYSQGYFRQVIDNDGAQKAFYPYNSPGQLPITPLRRSNGEWMRLEVTLPGWSVWLRIWEVQVGRVKLYLIDSNDAANFPPHRGITSELYGGDSELRLKQELILGIAGWRLLEELGLSPDVCHLNEGHAAFAVLERARTFMVANQVSFEVALQATRMGNVFTTHTAVPAGFDCFSPQLIEQYLGNYATARLGISLKKLLALGRLHADNEAESFNMAYLAIRGSGAANAVSRLHGKVSRQIFSTLFPRWPESEIPIGHVTNGIHTPSWASSAAGRFWQEHCGPNCWRGDSSDENRKILQLSDAQLWKMRNAARADLIDYCRERLARTLEARAADEDWVELSKHIFDPNVLTLGFARRFATYKRPNLLLSDPERLLRLLSHPHMPVQLVIAGKAHPADRGGQALIQQWMRFIMRKEVRPHVIFIEDYDMLVTQQMVRGVDLWVNTPRRPWEACGTSGMKVLVNGGINLSELDGWWSEAYAPDIGWSLGDGREHGDDPAADAADAEQLYELLENQVVPEFYQRNPEGIPSGWVAKLRNSMARLTPQYSADRAVRQYTEQLYLPAARAFQERSRDQAALSKSLFESSQKILRNWSSIRLGEIHYVHCEGVLTCEAQIYLGELAAEQVRVELYADGCNGTLPEKLPLEYAACLTAVRGLYLFRLAMPTGRPTSDYTLRVIPCVAGLKVPLELGLIIWQV